jgi:hypothetical protein
LRMSKMGEFSYFNFQGRATRVASILGGLFTSECFSSHGLKNYKPRAKFSS